MAVDDPTGFNASILGEIKRINARLDQLSGAPLGKLKTRTAANYYSGFSWTGTATAGPRSWITAGAAIVVPPFATKVWIHALATSVVCSNKAANVSAFSYLTITIPELGITQADGPNVFVPSDQQAQRARAGTWAELPVTAGDTFTVTAGGDAYNTGTNADNYLSIDALAIFQY